MILRKVLLDNDVLIALSARALGATVLTADEDYDAIRAVLDFKLERIVA
ncbi:hypothetical protein [Sorangium sp. So ce426]